MAITKLLLLRSSTLPLIEGILPKGPYPPCLRMAGRALLAGYPRNLSWWCSGRHFTIKTIFSGTQDSHYKYKMDVGNFYLYNRFSTQVRWCLYIEMAFTLQLHHYLCWLQSKNWPEILPTSMHINSHFSKRLFNVIHYRISLIHLTMESSHYVPDIMNI